MKLDIHIYILQLDEVRSVLDMGLQWKTCINQVWMCMIHIYIYHISIWLESVRWLTVILINIEATNIAGCPEKRLGRLYEATNRANTEVGKIPTDSLVGSCFT